MKLINNKIDRNYLDDYLNDILLNYINKNDFNNLVDNIPKSFDLKDLNLNTNNKIDSLIIDDMNQ